MISNHSKIGAYGTVYKIQRSLDGRFFALKKMNVSGIGQD